MNAFDKIIGYETIKTELLQICDMIHNRKIYDDLGANLQIHVYVGGTFREMSKLVYTNGNVVANTSRPDVADVFGSHVGNSGALYPRRLCRFWGRRSRCHIRQ